MIASLPMYVRASNRAAHDALWALIRDGLRARGIIAPDALDHDIDYMAGWARPDLVLGHICNLPYRAQFQDKVTRIGAAHYHLPDCVPGHYTSYFVVRDDCTATQATDMAAARFACNSLLSQSGYGAAQLWAKTQGFRFGDPLVTGAHSASIAAVVEDRADIALIDAQTWWIETQSNLQTRALKIIGQTQNGPGMTFITRTGEDPKPYFNAIQAAFHMLPAKLRDQLNLRDIIALPESAYDIPLPPKPQTFQT